VILIPVLAMWTPTVVWLKITELELFGCDARGCKPPNWSSRGFPVDDFVLLFLYFYYYLVLMFGFFLLASGLSFIVCHWI